MKKIDDKINALKKRVDKNTKVKAKKKSTKKNTDSKETKELKSAIKRTIDYNTKGALKDLEKSYKEGKITESKYNKLKKSLERFI